MARLPRLFISYSKQDAEFVRYLAALLKAQGFSVWYDDQLNPGEDWWTVLEREIHACDAFVVVMTHQARSSRWVLQGLPKLSYTKLREFETGLAAYLEQLKERGKL